VRGDVNTCVVVCGVQNVLQCVAELCVWTLNLNGSGCQYESRRDCVHVVGVSGCECKCECECECECE